MKRLCVFAHYDKDNLIDDYVIYYLNALKEVCETIIFVSDCDLEPSELEKLQGIADYSIAHKHGEYDFGSYKRGFFFAKEKGLVFDELLFVNDSCYGPFYPLKPIFESMEKKKCDFWGMSQNRYGIKKIENKPNKPIVCPHIQSYFLVFKSNVVNSCDFIHFMESIHSESEKDNIIIKYEIGLSQLLYSKGFKSEAYIKKYKYTHNCLSMKWNSLISKDYFPFLKTTIIKNGFYFTGEVKGWDLLLTQYTDYPVELIKKHSQRVLDLYEDKYSKLNIYRKIRFNLLKNTPLEFRYCIIFLEKYIFITINYLCFGKLKKF